MCTQDTGGAIKLPACTHTKRHAQQMFSYAGGDTDGDTLYIALYQGNLSSDGLGRVQKTSKQSTRLQLQSCSWPTSLSITSQVIICEVQKSLWVHQQMTVDSCHKVTLVASLPGDLASQQQQYAVTYKHHLCSLAAFPFESISIFYYVCLPFLTPSSFHFACCVLTSAVQSPVMSTLFTLLTKRNIKKNYNKRKKKSKERTGGGIPDIIHRCKRICCTFVSQLSTVDLQLRPDWVKHVSSW